MDQGEMDATGLCVDKGADEVAALILYQHHVPPPPLPSFRFQRKENEPDARVGRSAAQCKETWVDCVQAWIQVTARAGPGPNNTLGSIWLYRIDG